MVESGKLRFDLSRLIDLSRYIISSISFGNWGNYTESLETKTKIKYEEWNLVIAKDGYKNVWEQCLIKLFHDPRTEHNIWNLLKRSNGRHQTNMTSCLSKDGKAPGHDGVST